MDLTFQVPIQYCSLQHRTLLRSPVISTTGCCFCFGSVFSFFLDLFLHWSPVSYWAPTDLGSSSFHVLYFCLFILFIWLWSTEWSRTKDNTVLPRECTGHSKHPLPTTQEKTLHTDITRWPTPKSEWLYSLQPKMEKLYTISKNKTGSWLWLRSWILYCQIQT